MEANTEQDQEDRLSSLVVVLPLAVMGFVVAAACWTLFAVAGIFLRDSLGLSNLQLGLLLATPMATGGLLAVPAGLAAQKLGARRVMIGCLAGLALCMLLLLVADSFAGYLVVAGGLGLAGCYFSAGQQFVTHHAPARHMGLALGVFGAGVVGAGLSYYLVPLLMEAFSWGTVPVAYLIVLLVMIALLVLLTDDSDSVADPDATPLMGIAVATLRRLDVWLLCFWFGIVAGSFYSLALWLPDVMAAQMPLTVAGGASLALWFVIPGALAQVLGGALADRFGTQAVVMYSLLLALAVLAALSVPPLRELSDPAYALAYPLAVDLLLVLCLGVALGCAIGGLLRKMVDENPQWPAFAAGILLQSACVVAFWLPVVSGAVSDWLAVSGTVFVMLFLLLLAGCLLFVIHGQLTDRNLRKAGAV